MRAYNGFNHGERVAGGNAQRLAAKQGKFVFPSTCSICGYTAIAEDREEKRSVIAHLEDYRHPLECLPCCRKCHHALHHRFSRPGRWLELVEKYSFSGAWFEKLSMDVTIQLRPYDEIYPPRA